MTQYVDRKAGIPAALAAVFGTLFLGGIYLWLVSVMQSAIYLTLRAIRLRFIVGGEDAAQPGGSNRND